MKRTLFFFLIAILCSMNLLANVTIRGTVVDKNKNPLIGVQVKAETYDAVVTTDLDGRFEISVPEGTELTFSMLGANTKTKVAEDGMVVVMGLSNPIWYNTILAEYGFCWTDMFTHSIGIRYGVCRNLGCYVGARYVTSDFKFRKSEGTMDGDGFIFDPTSGSGRPFMSGLSSRNQLTVSAGLLCRMSIPLYCYAGAGYGYRQTFYQTTGGYWLKCQKDKSSLVIVELGLIGDIHSFTLSAGCELILAPSIEIYPKIGIGYTFPMKKTKSDKGAIL